MTVLIYVDTSNKQVGDPDHLKVFANADAAAAWFAENDPEGVAFEYWAEAAAQLNQTRPLQNQTRLKDNQASTNENRPTVKRAFGDGPPGVDGANCAPQTDHLTSQPGGRSCQTEAAVHSDKRQPSSTYPEVFRRVFPAVGHNIVAYVRREEVQVNPIRGFRLWAYTPSTWGRAASH